MDYLYIELPIKTKLKLLKPETYRLFINNNLIIERNMYWDTDNNFVLEKIVLKPLINIDITLTSTNNNNFKIHQNYLDLTEITVGNLTTKINSIFKVIDPRIKFPFSNKINLTV